MKFDAVIWDMDGLLLDTERLAHESWQQASRELETGIDDTLFLEIIGMNVESFHRWLDKRLGHSIDVDRLVQRANDIYHAKIENGSPLKAGAQSCVEWLAAQGVAQAVATSSNQELAQRKLGRHGLLRHFGAIVSGDQVTHGKPHPEIFLKAAQSLRKSADRCLVFEDSRLGVMGAAAAGATVILVPDLAVHDTESRKLAFEIWDSLEEGLDRFGDWFA